MAEKLLHRVQVALGRVQDIGRERVSHHVLLGPPQRASWPGPVTALERAAER